MSELVDIEKFKTANKAAAKDRLTFLILQSLLGELSPSQGSLFKPEDSQTEKP
jgi:hypothetical protein